MSSDGKVNFAVDDDNSWTPDDVATSGNAYDVVHINKIVPDDHSGGRFAFMLTCQFKSQVIVV